MDSCNSDETVIESPYIHGLRICRQLEIYVNPASKTILELGTRSHPYKNINLAILEIFNLMANRDLTVTVKLSKIVPHYLMHSKVSLYNITKVIFEPYTGDVSATGNAEYGNNNLYKPHRHTN